MASNEQEPWEYILLTLPSCNPLIFVSTLKETFGKFFPKKKFAVFRTFNGLLIPFPWNNQF